MVRKAAIFSLLGFISLSMIILSTANCQTERKYFKEAGYSFEVPTAFKIDPKMSFGDYVSLRWDGAPDTHYPIIVNIIPREVPAGYEKLDDYFREVQNQLRSEDPTFRSILETGKTRVAGFDAKWMVSSHGHLIKKATLFIKNKFVYVINCSAGEDAFDKYSDIFSKIVASFRFE